MTSAASTSAGISAPAPDAPTPASLSPTSPAATLDDDTIGVRLGQRLRDARAHRGLSMRKVAAAADISQGFLSQIEAGRTMPSIGTLFRLANVLGISPSALLPSPEEPDPIRLSRRLGTATVAVSEGADAAVSRIISSEATHAATVQEYLVHGPYLGEWFESDGENTVYLSAGALRVDIDGYGSWDLEPGDALSHPGAFRNRWQVPDDTVATILLVHAPETQPSL